MKLTIGFITYNDNSAKYLPFFLPSLRAALDLLGHFGEDYEVLVVDNSDPGRMENSSLLKEYFPKARIIKSVGNLGFSRAYNLMFQEANQLGAEYFLMLNPDMVLDNNSITRLFEAISADESLAVACPEILRWDFEDNRKTEIIDTLGIGLDRGLRFFDIGQGDLLEEVIQPVKFIGPSGAGALFRLSSLSQIVIGNNQVFDERFFMYKEDCDLAYRIYLAGLKCFLVEDAILYHDRSAVGRRRNVWQIISNRFKKSKKIKNWSFVNEHLIYFKYWELQPVSDQLIMIWSLIRLWAFALVFEPYLLKNFKTIKRLWQGIRAEKRALNNLAKVS